MNLLLTWKSGGYCPLVRSSAEPAPIASEINFTARQLLNFYHFLSKIDKINGGWCGWHKISPCSASCGVGVQEMIRYCSCPAPGNGGKSCSGENRSTISCFESNCTYFTTNGMYCFQSSQGAVLVWILLVATMLPPCYRISLLFYELNSASLPFLLLRWSLILDWCHVPPCTFILSPFLIRWKWFL